MSKLDKAYPPDLIYVLQSILRNWRSFRYSTFVSLRIVKLILIVYLHHEQKFELMDFCIYNKRAKI